MRERKGSSGFAAVSGLTRRIAGAWLLLAALAAGYAALGGVVVVWVTGWSWWFGTAVSVGLIAVLYALDDRTVLPKHLTRVRPNPSKSPCCMPWSTGCVRCRG